jgi:uncharacterized protein YfaS (alpha-2-macroglobulin family)
MLSRSMDLLRSILLAMANILRKIFGELQWKAPTWTTWLGGQVRAGFRYTTATRQRALIAGLALAAGIGGATWYEFRPKPHYVEYTVNSPKLTTYDDKGMPVIYPLTVEFKESVAALAGLDKPITAGIEMSPKLAGQWNWVNDRHLQFVPTSDWPVDGSFKVKLDRGKLFANNTRLDNYSFPFVTQPFAAKIKETQFYQDPQNPALKKVVATVAFSHPVDTGEFEQHVSLEPGKDAAFLGLTSDVSRFTVLYDKLRLNAFIHSAALAMPKDDTSITVKIGKGVHAARGGNQTADRLDTTIGVPGRTSLKFSDAQMTLVDNAKYEPEQILLIKSTSPVQERGFAGKVQAYVLPVRHPDQPKEDKKPYQWYNPEQVGTEILAKSQALPLTYVSSDGGSELLHGFKFNAPVDRFIWIVAKAGIEGTGGYLSGQPYSAIVKVTPYRQALTFIGKGALLSMAGDKKVGFLVRDVGRVQVDVGRVLPNQLQHLAPRMWDFAKPQIYGLEDSIVERFTTTRDYNAKPGKPVYDSIDLGRYLTDQQSNRRGLFLLHVRSVPSGQPQNQPADEQEEGDGEPEGDGGYRRYDQIEDSRLILVTDLGFIVKQWNDGRRDVFVQSIQNGTPVSGARVEVIGANGEPVAAATTDSDGRAQFAKLPNTLQRERNPLLLLVRKDADFSFMPLSAGGRYLDTSRFETGGVENAESAQQLSSYLFTDRGIYRPGETAHIGMITRTADWQSSATSLPLDVEITDARGNIVQRNKVKLSQAAFDEITFSTQATAPTGTYQATVWLPKNERRRDLLGSVSFDVQEFEPDRMKVRLDLGDKTFPGWMTSADVKARVTAAHLFGEPASNRRVEGELNLSPVLPRFTPFPDYRFQIGEVVKEPLQEALQASVTDNNGVAQLNLNLERFTGRAYRLSILARVFEAEGGRSVAAQNSAIVADVPYLVGVKPDGDMSFVRRNSTRQARWLAVNQQLTPVAAAKLTLEKVQREYLSVLTQQEDGTYKYVSRLKETVRDSRPVQIPAGGANFPLPTQEPGDFILILRNEDGAELNRLNYTIAGDANISRSLERNAELQIQLDKASYAGGETISVSIRAPYAGSGLITIERDRVFHHQWFHSSTTSSVQRITLPSGFEGNGYVSVQFLRDPSSDEIFMSPLSYGVAAFAADLDPRTQQVSLTAASQVKPGAALAIRVAPAVASRVAVFAVDEGILQVARYRNPDPLGHFFEKRMLQVQTTQILDLILPEFRRFVALAAAGGDADGGFARHLNPFNRKHKPPVAWWSGIVDAGPAGKTFRYNVPDYFNGRLRLIAVAVDAARVGVATVNTEVKGDFILTPNVPVMVAPGDEFEVSVGVFNSTTSKDPVRVQVQASRELTAAGSTSADLTIAPKSEGTALFRFKANTFLAPASLKFSAVRGASAANIEESVSVRPAVAYRTQLTLGSFNSSSTTVPLKRDFYPELRSVQASVSALPLVWGEGLIAYLDTYPYPCTEQLVSKGFAALMLASRPDFGAVKTREAQPISGTLAMLQTRENESGGFGLWTSSPQTAEFPTIYAAHFLIEARERGEKVPPEMLNSLNAWLTNFASAPAPTLEDGRMRAYAVYLLARQGIKPAAAVANVEQELSKRYTQTWGSDLAAAYLASAYRLMQRNTDADRILAKVPWAQGKRDWTDGIYYDPVVHDAQLLYLTARHFPDRVGSVPQASLEGIAKAISGNQVSSLSAAYTLVALDAYSKAAAPKVKLGVLLNGQTQTGTSKVPVPLGNSNVAFSRDGNLTAYYSVNESGFDRNAPAQNIENGIEVIHEFVDAKGNVLTRVKVGDEFLVRLRLRSTTRERVRQIAVVDLLPGGVEPTLDRQPLPGANWTPEYADYRDDRVVLYGDATKSVQTFVYKVRATNAGTFQVPPAFAEGMYNRQITGQSQSAKLEIVKP